VRVGAGYGTAFWVALTWIVLIVAMVLLVPVLPLADPTASWYPARQAPGAENLLGTDNLGRDLLSRVMWGARSSLAVGVGAVLIGLVVGGALGLVAGYAGGRTDRVISSVLDALVAIPPLLFALATVAVLATGPGVTDGQRLLVITGALGWVTIAFVGRIARTSTLSWSRRGFVDAARIAGARTSRILFRELIPNVVPAVLSAALLFLANLIIAEGVLSFLGVGVQLPTPSWGNIIAESREGLLLGAPHMIFAPAAFIFATVLSLNYLGDALRERHLDVRERVL
jgi:peptide/nickel transport system permease protein